MNKNKQRDFADTVIAALDKFDMEQHQIPEEKQYAAFDEFLTAEIDNREPLTWWRKKKIQLSHSRRKGSSNE